MNSIFKKKTMCFLLSSFLLSSTAYAATTSSQSDFQCSDEEVKLYIQNSNSVDRAELSSTSYKDLQSALITMQHEKKKTEGGSGSGGEYDCFAILYEGIDLGKMGDEIFDLINGIQFPSMDINKIFDKVKEKIYDDLLKSICKRAPEYKDSIIKATKTSLENKRKEYEQEFKNSSLGMFYDEKSFDKWMNNTIKEEFDDDAKILLWRGGISGSVEVSDDSRKWGKELDGLFD